MIGVTAGIIVTSILSFSFRNKRSREKLNYHSKLRKLK